MRRATSVQAPNQSCRITLYFRLPKSAKKSVIKYVQEGGIIPYLTVPDITDNLNKGVIDVCKGLVFEDDSKIWIMDGCVTKQYALEDRIELEFEETPDVMTIDGILASEQKD